MSPEGRNVDNSYSLSLEFAAVLGLTVIHRELQRHLYPAAHLQLQLRGSLGKAAHRFAGNGVDADPFSAPSGEFLRSVLRISPRRPEIFSAWLLFVFFLFIFAFDIIKLLFTSARTVQPVLAIPDAKLRTKEARAVVLGLQTLLEQKVEPKASATLRMQRNMHFSN